MINAQFKNSSLVVLILFVGIVLSFFANPLFVWGGLLALMIGAALIGKKHRVVFVYGCWAALAPLVEKTVGGPSTYIDELLILACLATLLGSLALRRESVFEDSRFLSIYLFLLGVVGISIVLNSVSPVAALNVLLSYYSFPVVLFLSFKCRSSEAMLLFIKMAIVFFLVQILLNMGWILGMNPLPNRHAWVRNMSDICHGSIGRADWIAYAMICMTFLFISTYRLVPKKNLRRVSFILLPFVLLQFRLAYTNHAIPYFAGAFGIYLLITGRKFVTLMKYLLVITLLLLSVSFLESAVKSARYGEHSESISELYSKRNLEHRWRNFVKSPKLNLIRTVSIDWLHSYPQRWMIGMGAGNGTSAVGMTRVSPGALELLADFYLTQTGRQEREGSSLLESTYSGISAIWSEVGIVGFLLYLLLYLFVVIRVFVLVWKQVYTNIYQRILAEAFVPSMAMFILSNFLNELLFSNFWMVLIWGWAGLVYSPLETAEGSLENNGVEGPDISKVG